tara:strand:+ start:662426 stop:664588 length:2163 start_codon:yes stop_codon:yes gene_type:complete
MHADALNEWLKPYAELSGQHIDDVLSDVIAIWAQDDKLHNSGDLALKLTQTYLQQHNITPEAQQKILADVADIEALKRFPDHTTGVLPKDHKGVETALAHLYAKETQRPVAMFEFDFGNMGGTNELFQRKFAVQDYAQANGINDPIQAQKQFDALAPEIRQGLISDINIKRTFDSTDKAAKIVTQSILTDLAAHYPDSSITAIRTGGDELRFIIEPADPKTYQDVIMAATHNVEIKMAQLGLLDHEHAKGRDNKYKNGFGGGLAAIDMRNINDPDNITAKMDIAVKGHKDSIGEMRVNDHIDIHARIKQNMGIAVDTDLSQLSPELRTEFYNAFIDKKYILNRNAENIRAHAPSPANTLHEYNQNCDEILSAIDNTKTPHVTDPTLKYAANVEGLDIASYDTIEQRRVAYMEQIRTPEYVTANNGQSLNSAITTFMNHEARSLNPIDPSAKVSTISDFTENTTLWHDASSPEPHALFVGFLNLGGLNDLLGHDGADAVLKDMALIVQESLQQAGINENQYVIAHNGGGEFRVVIQPHLATQIALAQDAISEKTAILNNQTIDTYMKGKGIDLDAATLNKIQAMRFTDIEDPKVRTALYNDNNYELRINGLMAISTSAPIEIDAGAPNKAWTPGHALGYMKDDLEIATESFRYKAILEAHGLETQSPPILKECHSNLTHNRGTLHGCFEIAVEKVDQQTDSENKGDNNHPSIQKDLPPNAP